MIKTFDKQGPGKKLCNGCGKYVAARVLECNCGNKFSKIEKEIKKKTKRRILVFSRDPANCACQNWETGRAAPADQNTSTIKSSSSKFSNHIKFPTDCPECDCLVFKAIPKCECGYVFFEEEDALHVEEDQAQRPLPNKKPNKKDPLIFGPSHNINCPIIKYGYGYDGISVMQYEKMKRS